MNTELIAQTWDVLQDHTAFVKAFYRRFFERFPGYRPLFPRELNPDHLAKMVETMSLMSRLAEEEDIIAPHVRKLGTEHKPYALKARDLDNFKAVFVEMLSEHVGAAWSPLAAEAWSEAFDRVIIPLMREGSAA